MVGGEVIAARLADGSDGLTIPFCDILTLTHRPHVTLYSLYQGWIDAVQALSTAKVTGDFSIPFQRWRRQTVRRPYKSTGVWNPESLS